MRLFKTRSSRLSQSLGSIVSTASRSSTSGTMQRLSRVDSMRNFFNKRFRSFTKKDDAVTLPDNSTDLPDRHHALEKSLSESALMSPSRARDTSPEILKQLEDQRSEVGSSIRNLKQRATVLDYLLSNMCEILSSHESTALAEKAVRLVDHDDTTPLAEPVIVRCQQRQRQRRDSRDSATSSSDYSRYSCRSSYSCRSCNMSTNSAERPDSLNNVMAELNDVLHRLNVARSTDYIESGYESDSTRADSPVKAMPLTTFELFEPLNNNSDVDSTVYRDCNTKNAESIVEVEDSTLKSDDLSIVMKEDDNAESAVSVSCEEDETSRIVNFDENLSLDEFDATIPVSDDEEADDEESMMSSRPSSYSSYGSKLDYGFGLMDSVKDNTSRSCTIVEALTKDGRVVSECEMEGFEVEQMKPLQQQQQLRGMRKFQICKRVPTLSSVVLEATASKKVFTVTLEKGCGKRLGFSIVGGSDNKKGRNKAISVKSIFENCEAAINGELMVNDEILAVNDVPLAGMTHDKATQTFRSLKSGKVVMHVARK